MTRERPILFSVAMVRAILAGRKTQTRRIARDDRPCPYGAAGDRLWVREAFAYVGDGGPNAGALYRADGHNIEGSWRPSIHMPRWASRITLEIAKVDQQWLQKINEADARAEGVPSRTEFAALWDRLNAARAPWSENPWVWVVTFRASARGDRVWRQLELDQKGDR